MEIEEEDSPGGSLNLWVIEEDSPIRPHAMVFVLLFFRMDEYEGR